MEVSTFLDANKEPKHLKLMILLEIYKELCMLAVSIVTSIGVLFTSILGRGSYLARN